MGIVDPSLPTDQLATNTVQTHGGIRTPTEAGRRWKRLTIGTWIIAIRMGWCDAEGLCFGRLSSLKLGSSQMASDQ